MNIYNFDKNKKIHKLKKNSRAKKGSKACGEVEQKGYMQSRLFTTFGTQGWMANMNLPERLSEREDILKAVLYQLRDVMEISKARVSLQPGLK